MPWNDTTRPKYDRNTDRYPSDITDAQWAIIEPLVPLAGHRGRPRTADMREVINAICNCSPPIQAPKIQQQFQSQLLRQDASFTFGCDDLNRLLLILSLRLSFSASFVQSGSTSREIIA